MKQILLPGVRIAFILLTLAGSQSRAIAKEPTLDDRFRSAGRAAPEDELPLLTPPQSKLVHENPSGDVITGPAYLGVTFGDDERRAVVKSIAPGSPAEQAGVKPGDVMETLQGIAIDSPQDVLDLIKKMRPGTMLDIGVSRRVNLHAQAPLAVLPGATSRIVGYPPDSSSSSYNASATSTREFIPVPRSVQANPPKAKPQPYRNPANQRQSPPSSNQRRSNNQNNNNNNRGLLNRDRR